MKISNSNIKVLHCILIVREVDKPHVNDKMARRAVECLPNGVAENLLRALRKLYYNPKEIYLCFLLLRY